MHETLFVRIGPDGARYGEDRLDPLLWETTTYPLVGERHGRVLALLDEFLRQPEADLKREPLARALLQHDLWVMFDWTFERNEDPFTRQREALRSRLAAAMRRLALSPAEIATLPDNYAEAVSSKVVPGLPQRLVDDGDDWVLLGREDGAAITPVHMTEFDGRSTFEVRLSLPGGRETTRKYLSELRGAIALVKAPIQDSELDSAVVLPKLPQFPVGTQWALVRRLIVIGSDGQPHATRFIESIQLRKYRLIDRASPPDFDRAQQVMDFVAHRDASGTLRPDGARFQCAIPVARSGSIRNPRQPAIERPAVRPEEPGRGPGSVSFVSQLLRRHLLDCDRVADAPGAGATPCHAGGG